jgi:hypothetical protein
VIISHPNPKRRERHGRHLVYSGRAGLSIFLLDEVPVFVVYYISSKKGKAVDCPVI